MRKQFKSYVVAWAILLGLFNVIAFVSPGWIDVEKYTDSFWIGYAFITACFIGNLICTAIAFRAGSPRKFFYNIPLITLSYAALIVSFFVGGACMITSTLEYWIAELVCAIVFALFAVAVVKANAAAEIVEREDVKIKEQTSFLKNAAVTAQNLAGQAKDPDDAAACRKIYEALRYSDPVSSPEIAVPEAKIIVKMDELSSAVAANDSWKIGSLSDEILRLIEERNALCKASK